MAEITLTIPDAKAQEALLGVSTAMGYREQIEDPETMELVDNPQSRAEFVKEQLTNYLKLHYRRYKLSQLEDDKQQAIEEAETFTSDFN